MSGDASEGGDYQDFPATRRDPVPGRSATPAGSVQGPSPRHPSVLGVIGVGSGACDIDHRRLEAEQRAVSPPRRNTQSHVWAVRAPAPWDEELMHSLLDAKERRKAGSFAHRRDRSMYVTSHVALRLLLAADLGMHPRDIRFAYEPCARCGGPHGRPVLLDSADGPHFSLSHCAGLSLIAVATAPVGVDAERLPRPRTLELCMSRLHPAERRELLLAPHEERPLRFCRLWARKEAYLKALGTGLSRGLERDYLGDGSPRASAMRPAGWTVLNLPCGPQDGTHAAALAVPAGMWVPAAPREFDWSRFESLLLGRGGRPG